MSMESPGPKFETGSARIRANRAEPVSVFCGKLMLLATICSLLTLQAATLAGEPRKADPDAGQVKSYPSTASEIRPRLVTERTQPDQPSPRIIRPLDVLVIRSPNATGDRP